ncbi:hypothetical protein FQN49_006270 [Arthroderma sp. PD_2]|nr:hypothetical protein FQN49_006270 [Arthroderma sp. PD_2]
MRVVSIFVISLLARLARAAVLFNGSFAIFDDYSGSGFTIGTTGPLKGLVEVRPNTIDKWLIETIPGTVSDTTGTTAIIRHVESNLFIRFLEYTGGQTAILSDDYPTIFNFDRYENLRFRITLPLASRSDGPGRCVVEKYSTLDNRLVVRFRSSRAKPEGRSYFSVLGTPNATLHE